MNETTETTVSTEADLEAFDSGWDEDFTAPATTETTDETVEETAEETETEESEDGANQTDEETEGEAESENKPAEATTEETFELNYMGQRESVGRNEMIALAQKGKDYDRIHGKLDEALPELESLRSQKADFDKYSAFLSKLAKQSNTDIQGLMDAVEAKVMANEKGISEDIALERVKLNRERAEFEASKKKPAEKAEEKVDTPDPAEAKRRDEFVAFANEYPDVKPESIPKEVWDEFNKGKSLVGAYSRYENKQLREQLKTMEQNHKNRERSTGSRDSAGVGKQKDAFDIGWDY